MIVKHSIYVQNRVITHPFGDMFITSNIDVDTLDVVYDSDWDDLDRLRCVFVNGDVSVGLDLDPNNKEADITVPAEVLDKRGRLFVSFIGYKDEARIVTEVMNKPYVVKDSGRIDGYSPNAPTKDEITVLMESVGVATEAAYAAAKRADEAADRANDAADYAIDTVEKIEVGEGSALTTEQIDTLFN